MNQAPRQLFQEDPSSAFPLQTWPKGTNRILPLLGQELIPSENDLARSTGLSRITVQRVLAQAKSFGLVAADRRHGWQHRESELMPTDASLGHGLVLLTGTSAIATTLGEILASRGLALLWTDRPDIYNDHRLVTAAIHQHESTIRIRIADRAQDIIAASTAPQDLMIAGMVAGWRFCLLAAGLAPSEPLLCRSAPPARAQAPSIASMLSAIQDLPSLTPLPDESEAPNWGISLHQWRRQLRALKDLGLVLRNRRRRWLRWRPIAQTLESTQLVLSTPLTGTVFERIHAGLLDLPGVAVAPEPKPSEDIAVSDEDGNCVIIPQSQFAHVTDNALLIDYRSYAELIIRILREQGCQHILFIHLVSPPIWIQGGQTVAQHCAAAGFEMLNFPLQNTFVDRIPDPDDLARLKHWSASGHPIAILSLSGGIAQQMATHLQRDLGDQLLVGLEAGMSKHLKQGFFHLPRHSMRFAGLLAACMLQELRWTHSSRPRQIRIPAFLMQ